ncbi:MAG: PAS domain S-box protein [Opitutaceae bacterium]|nr:PAS domain S-box protein [Opitutaceae bacterium]
MIQPLASRLLEKVVGDDAPDLRTQIFRLVSMTTATLCLLFIVPLNFAAHLPPGVHLASLALGASNLIFHLLSRRGRTYCATFLASTVLLIDAIWFWNGGSHGSVTYFFAPILLFSLAVYDGWRRVLVATAQTLNTAALVVIEHLEPSWVTPFATPSDRFVDHFTGIIAAATATTAIGWFIIRAHAREQHRLAELAKRLALSEDRYRQIFDSTSDALFVHAPDGRLLDLNARACALFGVDRATALKCSFNECSLGESPYSEVEARAHIARAIAGEPQVFEWQSRRISGELFWSEVALKAAEFGGEGCVIASVRDITLRMQVQRELEANEERLRLAMLASRQGWFEINVQTGTGVSSPEYPRILGYEPAEFITTIANWLEGIHPEDRAAAQRELRSCIESGETRAIEYRRRTKDGSWRWIRSVGRIVDRDAQGRPLRMIGMHTDINDRKELEAQLLHSQRLEAVGTLASGVAHDLNNILTPMLMGAGLLHDKLADEEDRELMAMIESSGRRGAAIVKQLLAFSRSVAPERRPLAPAALVLEVVQLIRSTFPKEITIREEIGECPYEIEGDSTQLHQVLVNLAVNARDAMPQGGTLTLGLECCSIRPPGTDAPNAPPESFLILRVSDTGHGITPEIRERIFDPFFTTKEPGKGTGLGLATVHGIVTAHRGFIRFDSTPGRGTEFRVYLPALAPGSARAAGQPAAVLAPSHVIGGRAYATLLLVDDEPAVLRTTRRTLERDGFEVLTAASGAEALQLARERAADIELVITDFMMPEMDGPTLVPLLREVLPGVPIIGVSGLDQRARAAELGLAEVLCKPFDGSILVTVIHRVLAHR